MSKPFTKAEIEKRFQFDAPRILATIEMGFAPDRDALREWAANEILFEPRSNPTENLVDALRVATEFGVRVTVELLNDPGRMTVTVNDEKLFEGPAGDEDAALALIAWLHRFDAAEKVVA